MIFCSSPLPPKTKLGSGFALQLCNFAIGRFLYGKANGLNMGRVYIVQDSAFHAEQFFLDIKRFLIWRRCKRGVSMPNISFNIPASSFTVSMIFQFHKEETNNWQMLKMKQNILLLYVMQLCWSRTVLLWHWWHRFWWERKRSRLHWGWRIQWGGPLCPQSPPVKIQK